SKSIQLPPTMQFYSLITLTITSLMVILSTMAAPTVSKCGNICPAIYKPICAQAIDGQTKTFANECKFKNYSCKHPNSKFVILAYSACEAPMCDFMCLMVEDPVCAISKDGKNKTFNNSCLLDLHNCQNPGDTFTLVSNGACPATPVCTDACTAVYQPVCAKLPSGETKTFGNNCELGAFNCKNPKDAFTFVSEGEC
ncbi:hypothetical protein BGZ97_005767, partial [Linnemannia gamsii]